MKESLTSNATIPWDEWYDNTGLAYQKAFSHNPNLHRIMETFMSHPSPGSVVLDCGCGTGKPVCDMLAQKRHQVCGIDWSKTMVQLSREQVPNGVYEQVNMLDYKPSVAFDGIVAMLSLFQLGREEIEKMATNWQKWLKPGGILLLGVFGAEDCQVERQQFDADGRFASGIEFRFMDNSVQMGLFTKPGWDELLETQGLKILSRTTEIFSPPKDSNSDDEPDYFVIARKEG